MNAEDWHARAASLRSNTRLSEQEAQVMAMRDFGYERRAIADELDISPNSVDDARQRAETKVREARRLLSYLGRGPQFGSSEGE